MLALLIAAYLAAFSTVHYNPNGTEQITQDVVCSVFTHNDPTAANQLGDGIAMPIENEPCNLVYNWTKSQPTDTIMWLHTNFSKCNINIQNSCFWYTTRGSS